jgi:hypothetical protein
MPRWPGGFAPRGEQPFGDDGAPRRTEVLAGTLEQLGLSAGARCAICSKPLNDAEALIERLSSAMSASACDARCGVGASSSTPTLVVGGWETSPGPPALDDPNR